MIDAHVHLDDRKYEGMRDQIIADFAKDNIDFVINSSSSLRSMNESFKLARKYDNIYTTIGSHPADATDFGQEMVDRMTDLQEHPKVVAVGEIGLDYHYGKEDIKEQKDVFARQIELADKWKLPIVLHIREAYEDFEDIMRAENRYLNNAVMLHCYSGSAEQARQYAKKGWFFSFGGTITYPNNRKWEVFQNIPVGQIVTETDGPYLTPVPYRGKINMPKYIKYILPLIADAYNMGVPELENQIDYNVRKIFPRIK